MQIEVQRKNGVPIYFQLKKQIEWLVRAGVWEVGRQLPTERELARALGISRNTVSAAYRRLEAEGILSSRQGRGTFVKSIPPSLGPEKPEDKALKTMELAMKEVLELGYSLDGFLELAQRLVRERKEILFGVKVAFIECNREQLDYFTKELELGSGVSTLPVLIQDYRREPAQVNAMLEGVDLVVTTFFHLDEVRELMADKRKELLGIALDPQLETIVKIARLPKKKKVGLVCLSEAFADRVRKSLANAGIVHFSLQSTTTRNRQQLLEFLQGVHAVIVSPSRKKEVESLLPRGREVIEFIYEPDAGSVNLLRSVVLERKMRMGDAVQSVKTIPDVERGDRVG